ncbi:hypothetical protein Tsubulata_037767 [Turnera subulata]|uniref:RING-type domain-containing protein n=1 Tax=Turnera subulata TaxID=218843 RepID=A0A9Q0G8V1_9ROSI|nr:hypothetical protein Tsubulata_037766 [Turnera subulata]KAJ4845303.1 hypothetical protein Tsubulata_037767 [Turnera subulata]
MWVVYYGLVVLGVIAIIIILYTLIMIGWCKFWSSHPEETSGHDARNSRRPARLNLIPYSASTFKYKRGLESLEEPTSQSECVVCLTCFEDEEYLQQLPDCRHSFHSPCIDMWLYSHSDCPVCRTPVHRIDPGTDNSYTETPLTRI